MSAFDMFYYASPVLMAGLLTAGAFWVTARDQRERARRKKTET